MTEPKSSSSESTRERFQKLLEAKKAKGGAERRADGLDANRTSRADGPKGSRTFKRRKV